MGRRKQEVVGKGWWVLSVVHITFQTSSEQPHREHESVGDLSLNKEQKVKDGGGGLVRP